MKQKKIGAVIFSVFYVIFLIVYFSLLASSSSISSIIPIDLLRLGCEIGFIVNVVGDYNAKKVSTVQSSTADLSQKLNDSEIENRAAKSRIKALEK